MSRPRGNHRAVPRACPLSADVSRLDNSSRHPVQLIVDTNSELDTLRTETQTAQHESATAASQTAAMMSLNLKLQSTASKNQARHIDLEVKRIEAREARELLNIVQVRSLLSYISRNRAQPSYRNSRICLRSMLSRTWTRRTATCSSSA